MALNAQVAARHHQPVGGDDNLVQVGDGRLSSIFAMMRAVDLWSVRNAEQIHICRFSNKRQGKEIHPLGNAHLDIRPVFLRDGRQVDFLAGQVEVPAAGQFGGHRDFAPHPLGIFPAPPGGSSRCHQDGFADGHIFGKIPVVDAHRRHAVALRRTLVVIKSSNWPNWRSIGAGRSPVRISGPLTSS